MRVLTSLRRFLVSPTFFISRFIISFCFCVFFQAGFVGVSSVGSSSNFEREFVEKNGPRRKKIKITSTTGGGWNSSIEGALLSCFGDSYDVSVFNVISDVLNLFDPIYKLSFGRTNGEGLYDFLISRGANRSLNFLHGFGRRFIKNNSEKIRNLIEDGLRIDKPDLLVSILPFLNFELACAAKNLGIKFLLICTDVYFDTYFSRNPVGLDFYYTIPLSDSVTLGKIAALGLKSSGRVLVGCPLRLDFFEKKDLKKIRKDFGLPVGGKILMLLMGGNGSSRQLSYLSRLKKIKKNLHIIFCAGRNKRLIRRLEKYKLPKNISISIFGYTDRISDLMAVSDILITKPGAGSFMESLAMGVPTIFDDTSVTLRWEKPHLDFVRKNSIGEVLTSFNQLEGLLEKLLFDEEYIKKVKKNMKKFSSSDFSNNLKNLVGQILD